MEVRKPSIFLLGEQLVTKAKNCREVVSPFKQNSFCSCLLGAVEMGLLKYIEEQ